jgi:hypothetical protein
MADHVVSYVLTSHTFLPTYLPTYYPPSALPTDLPYIVTTYIPYLQITFDTYGAFTLDVKSVLNENLGGNLSGTRCEMHHSSMLSEF